MIITTKYDECLKLLDFGTSRFTSPTQYDSRHWEVVDETLERIFARELGNDYSIRDKWVKPSEISDPAKRLRSYHQYANRMRFHGVSEDEDTEGW